MKMVEMNKKKQSLITLTHKYIYIYIFLPSPVPPILPSPFKINVEKFNLMKRGKNNLKVLEKDFNLKIKQEKFDVVLGLRIEEWIKRRRGRIDVCLWKY